MKRSVRHCTKAFTLIELSIVLVIIGLLVGGVLVGKDLIRASEIRQTISQKEKFDAAANAFRLKYNCQAGDCSNNPFGFVSFSTGTAPVAVLANGDGIVGSYVTVHTPVYECLNFFYWLRVAGLQNEPQQYLVFPTGGDTPNAIRAGAMTPFPPIRVILSTTGTGGIPLNTGGWMIHHLSGWSLNGFTNAFSGHYYNIAPDAGSYIRSTIRPIDLYSIDTKVDDGLPLTGLVLAIDNHTMGTSPNGFKVPDNDAGICTVTTNSPVSYATHSNPSCNAAWKAGF